MRRLVALVTGILTHLLFALGVGWMMLSLATGLQTGFGPFRGRAALVANALLALQYPALHSFFLASRGRRLLERVAPLGLGRDLSSTLYVAFASLQLVLVFGLWSPSGIVWWQATGALRVAFLAAYAASWLLLMKAMGDAGLPLQLGYLGWTAVFRGESPRYGALPETGLFRVCRQPVYLAFALTLWTGPVWTPDRLFLACAWTSYCLLGPLLKERRYVRIHGESFLRYREGVPYWLPRLRRRA